MLQGRHFESASLDTAARLGVHRPEPQAGGQGSFSGPVSARESSPRDLLARGLGLWRIAGAHEWLRILAATGLMAVVLAAAGGFGTEAMPLTSRLVYWVGLMGLGVAVGRLGARRLVPRAWFETRPFLVGALMVFAIGLPMTLFAALANFVFRGRRMGLAELADIAPSVLATTGGMVILAFMIQARAGAETHTAPAGAPPARFLARLTGRLAGAELWAVEAQDHYLRLHTSAGSDLILMRLADAVAELEGIEGARTHRSWWVARAAVRTVERAEGRAVLTLPDGTAAPVSRGYARLLKAAGWL